MKVKRSSYFIAFQKQANCDTAFAKMIKGGFVHQEASGIYTWLNLGQLMIEKLCKLIDEEHQKIGAIKILMPMLHSAKLWKQSNRFSEFGEEMLKLKDRKEQEFVFGPSAEELITNLLTKFSIKKNNYPLNFYNIQWKFRDEIRPRFGVVRSREFLMKDAYSFHKTNECLEETYKAMFELYSRIFHKLGLKILTLKADTGIMGGFLSHEFLIESQFGETRLNYPSFPKQPLAWEDKDCAFEDETQNKFAEIGHIYALGDKYSQVFNLKNPENNKPLLMGCYGIGITRIIGLMFEKENLGVLAPFKVTLVILGELEDKSIIERLYNHFDDIIIDDRAKISAGEKFAEADLIGSPLKIFIGNKELKQGKILVKHQEKEELIDIEEVFKRDFC